MGHSIRETSVPKTIYPHTFPVGVMHDMGKSVTPNEATNTCKKNSFHPIFISQSGRTIWTQVIFVSDKEKEAFKRHIGVGERQVTSRHMGSKRERPVINENNGTVAGKQIDHWDGRVDAVAHSPQGIYHKVAKGKVND